MQSGTGYMIDLFGGMLYLRPLENGEFAVGCDDSCEPKNKHWEKCFKDPAEAIALFEKVRKQRKLGFEYEWGREERWKTILEDSYTPKELIPFVEAASKDQTLRELYPVHSHEALGFSEVSVYPFTEGYPFVISKKQKLFVTTARRKPIGSGDVKAVVKIIRDIINKQREKS